MNDLLCVGQVTEVGGCLMDHGVVEEDLRVGQQPLRWLGLLLVLLRLKGSKQRVVRMLPIVSRLSQQAGKLLNTTHELRILLVHVRRCATHELVHNIKTWHAVGLLIHSEK